MLGTRNVNSCPTQLQSAAISLIYRITGGTNVSVPYTDLWSVQRKCS